jgi:predicted MFS family arabinose efflux permease
LEGDARVEWRKHWPVVLAANAGMAISAIPAYAVQMFIKPFQDEFGWSRTEISSVHLIGSLAVILLGSAIGFQADKLGARRIGLAAVTIMCFAVAMLSLTGASIWSWRALYLLPVIATVLIQPTVWTSAVTGFFSSSRALALAVALCGTSVCSMITPKLAGWLITDYGWRIAFVGLAVIWGAVGLPLVWLFFTSPTDQARMARSVAPPVAKPPFWASFRREVFKPRFLQLAVAGFCIGIVVITTATNIVPILTANGLTQPQVLGIAWMIGLASIAGRLTIGLLLDRLPGHFVAAVVVCLPIIGALILITHPGSLPAASIAVVIFGLSLGAELDIMAYLTSRYFRTASFGLLFGTIGAFLNLATGLGPVILQRVFDVTGSYVPALWSVVPVCLMSAILFLTMGGYPEGE